MAYLFGDSTPSHIDIDYVDFVQRMIDLCVELAGREQALVRLEEREVEAEQASSASADRLHNVATLVRDALEPVSSADEATTASRCATAIERAAADQVREELERERAALAATVRELHAAAQLERDACVTALESLLLHWDLPDTAWEVGVVLDGEAYTAVLSGTTSYGATTIVELCPSVSKVFDKLQRVAGLAPGLDLHAPHAGGWLRKSVKVVPQNISKHCVSAITCAPDHVRIQLRAQPDGEGGGYDFEIDRGNEALRVFQIGKDGARDEFDPVVTDVQPLLSFCEQLANAASELRADRRAVLEATFVGAPLSECKRPTELVRRLVAAMAPVVGEIAAHSLSPGELVLRQPVSDGRREEIFVSTKTLGRKIAALPEPMHALFAALQLEIPARAESEVAEIEPEMIVEFEDDQAAEDGADDDDDASTDSAQPESASPESAQPPPPPKPLTFLGQRSTTRPPTH